MRKHVFPGWLLLLMVLFLPAANQQKTAFKAHYKGLLSYNDGHFQRAVQQFERAHGIIPDNYNFALSLAVGLSRVGKADQGLSILRQSTQKLKKNDPALAQKLAYHNFYEGMILTYGGRHGDAIQPLKNSLEQQLLLGDPKMIGILHNAIGNAIMLNQGAGQHGSDTLSRHYHVHQRDMLRAFKHFDKALKYDPANKAALHNYFLIRDTLGMEDLDNYFNQRDSIIDFSNSELPDNTSRALQFAEYDELLFLLDISGSMVMETVPCMGSTRFDVMKNTAIFVLDSLPPSTPIGIGTIDGDCGTAPAAWEAVGALSHYDMRYQLRFLAPNGTTPLLERLQAAPELFQDTTSSAHKTIFLISDGANVCKVPGARICEWAVEIAKRNITINVLTFLDASQNNSNAFAEYGCLADNTGGQILYLDNYRCSYEYFGSAMMKSFLPTIPSLRKVQCWGPAVKGLWAIEIQ